MSRNYCFLLIVGLLLSSSCASKQVEAAEQTPWTVHVPKPDGAIQSLTVERIPLPHGITGAESLAFDRRGQGPYAGVSDGRVLRWDGDANGWTTFAYNANYKNNPICMEPARRPEDTESICGRPLGLQFHAKTGDLYIADAYLGLMKVGPDGGEAEVLAVEAGGVPFNFTNGIDVDQATGDVYFTDSSTTYTPARNTQIMIHRDTTGRLLRYDARAKRVAVLKAGLPYPNGVALSADQTHVVVAHTGPCQAFRYWIRGAKAGRYELLADLPGYADNVRRDTKGGYWFALNREKINATAPEHLVGVRVNSKGAEQEVMTAPKGVTLSDIAEKDGKLWLGSVELDHVGLVNFK
ncbi:protein STRICTOSIDINE SYNTHASE-LIKE 10 [Setaria italica]|uniref:Strictosidine synthase conserved region domain-containing protein n=1 Tax=Setaria italica TaxID=4555 RepID=K3YMG2_SETIT|nr:protein STRICTOSIDINE SYNTHASE-LIKE 10 [Setaria italica]